MKASARRTPAANRRRRAASFGGGAASRRSPATGIIHLPLMILVGIHDPLQLS